jgi:hypothetical protein
MELRVRSILRRMPQVQHGFGHRLPRYHGGELKFDHEKRQALHDNSHARTDDRHSACQGPCRERERGTDSYVSDVEADVHPHQTLEACRTGDVPKLRLAESNSSDRTDREAPRDRLKREMLEQRRSKAPRGERRGNARGGDNRETRPDKKTKKMLLLSAE